MNVHSKYHSKLEKILNIRHSLALVWESAKPWTLTNVVLIVVQGLIPLLSLYMIKLIIDTISAGLKAGEPMHQFQKIVLLIVLFGGVGLLGTLLQSLSRIIQEHQTLLVTDHVLDLLHSKSIAVDLEYYENPDYFDTLHQAQDEAIYRPTKIVHGLITMTHSAISMTAIAGLFIMFHWTLIFALLFAMLPGLFVRLKASRAIFSWQKKRTASEREAHYYHWMMTGDTYAKEIRQFGLGPLFMQRYKGIREKLRNERLTLLRHQITRDFWSKVWIVCVMAGLYMLLARSTLQGQLTIGTLVMFYHAIQRSQVYFGGILNGLAELYDDALFTSYLFDFLGIESKMKQPEKCEKFPVPVRFGIQFHNVCFGYPSSRRKVLQDINLHIQPGQVVAFVGDNGSGKTTLIKLLCRLYDPVSGSITVDGIQFPFIHLEDLRKNMSVLFQDFAQYQNTARENIWFGNWNETDQDHEAVQQAAARTGAGRVIESLPDNYDTLLGKWFDSGEELSIGEWQKIAFARSFVKEAPVLILDEPTSALDSQTEYRIFSQLQKMKGNKTVILISHRFSTVRMADYIYVLDAGQIIEEGTHRELLKREGKYAFMFKKQAESYEGA